MKRWFLRRWSKWVAGVVLALGAVGCVKPLYMTPETQVLATSVGLPSDLATNPNVVAPPDLSDLKPPATIQDANREPRYMTLQEATAIALERGTRGNSSVFNLTAFGSIVGGNGVSFNDDLVQFTGRGVGGDDAIRAFALDPAIVAADIEGALSKFDARLTSSMSWNVRDQAVANIFNNFNNGDFAAFTAGLIKPLPTGGTAGITFDVNYTKLSAVPQGFAVINPSYTPSVTLQFEQPLLRDAGVDINQLLPQHPGSTQFPFRPTGGRAEGILVTRIRADQARLEFERELNTMVFNVELAYWSLYSAYYGKYAAEQALKQGYITWEQLRDLQLAGLQTKQGVAQARAQFENFRIQYLTALQTLLENERRFRGLLGLPLEDGTRIVPADNPTLAPYKPDWGSAVNETMNRPELRMARLDLKAQQLNLMVQENNYRPDLRFFASYNVNGIGNRIDGPGPVAIINAQGQAAQQPGNAFAQMADNKFNNSTIGLRFDYPLGYRDAHAALKVAQLNLARSHVVLKNQERKATLFLGSIYQQLAAYQEQIKLQQARRIALGTQLEGQFERVKIGKDPLIQLLQAQQDFAASIQAESNAVANYNIAIAGFHFAKGTVLPYNNIAIADGPLPAAVAERAADHFGAKAAGLKLRERPAHYEWPKQPGLPDAPPTDVVLQAKPDADGAPAPVPAPAVIPPTAPKETAPIPPKEVKPTGGAAPANLPGLSAKDAVPAGPVVPAGSTPGTTVLPATPVSRYRPQ
ncbi:MAG TPA: TolC family protein [Gemmataceae bacterium]|nr:TolC family protein [Gemmataceae bacterium]